MRIFTAGLPRHVGRPFSYSALASRLQRRGARILLRAAHSRGRYGEAALGVASSAGPHPEGPSGRGLPVPCGSGPTWRMAGADPPKRRAVPGHEPSGRQSPSAQPSFGPMRILLDGPVCFLGEERAGRYLPGSCPFEIGCDFGVTALSHTAAFTAAFKTETWVVEQDACHYSLRVHV